MNFCSYLFLIICLIPITRSSDGLPDMVIHISRHGATYPSTPNNTLFKFSGKQGQILPIGLRQQYNLGLLMAKKYPNLLSTTDSNSILMQSIGFNTNKESLYAKMFGAFEGKTAHIPLQLSQDVAIPPFAAQTLAVNQLISDTANTVESVPNGFLPPKITSMFNSQDERFNNTSQNCKFEERRQIERENSFIISEMFTQFNETTTALNSLGFNIQSMKEMANIGDALKTMYLDGRDQELLQELRHNTIIYNDTLFASQWYKTFIMTGDKQEMIIRSLNLLDQIAAWSLVSLRRSSPLKFIFLEGDTAALLSLLGLYQIVNTTCLLENYRMTQSNRNASYPSCIFPSETSQITYEFFNTVGLPYVKFLYNGRPLRICNAGTTSECNLAAFVQETRTLIGSIPQDHLNEDCRPGFGKSSVDLVEPELPHSTNKLNKNTFLILVILSLTTIVFCTYQKSLRKDQIMVFQEMRDDEKGHTDSVKIDNVTEEKLDEESKL